jgi:hypothetical protein
MSTELQSYKQNRINQLTSSFNSNVARLKYNLAINVKKFQRSRVRNKMAYIYALIKKYNNDINILRNNLFIDIKKTNSFTSEFIVEPVNIKNKKALLIGINYINTPYQLYGCIDDTARMKELLTSYGFYDFKIITDLTRIKPTKIDILTEIKNLLANAKSGDLLFLYYSGHGSYTFDTNKDETDGRDEMLFSLDLKGIIDDEIKAVIKTNLKNDVTLVAMFDSCHSGTMLDLKYNYLDSNNYDKYTENVKVSECQGNVIMISGCMDSQTSDEAVIDNKNQGAVTWSFIDCIKKTPNCSWRELLKQMRNLLKSKGFTQIPQLSTDSFYDIDSKVFI